MSILGGVGEGTVKVAVAGAEQVAAGAEQALKDSLTTAEVALADTLSVTGGEVDRLTKVIDDQTTAILAELAAWREMVDRHLSRLSIKPV